MQDDFRKIWGEGEGGNKRRDRSEKRSQEEEREWKAHRNSVSAEGSKLSVAEAGGEGTRTFPCRDRRVSDGSDKERESGSAPGVRGSAAGPEGGVLDTGP